MSGPKSRLVGLRELVAAAKPHECPFCGDPRKPRGRKTFNDRDRNLRLGGRKAKGAPEGYFLTCGEPECADVAYRFYWQRDRNAAIQAKRRHLSDPSGTP